MGTSLRFADAVRELGAEARSLGLDVPGFRSPPRLDGVDRSLRRRPGATPAVAVRLRGRAFDAVLADMVEGVLVANACTGPQAEHLRRRLLETMSQGRSARAA